MSLILNKSKYNESSNIAIGDRIYYNLKLANIYNNSDIPIPFSVRDDTSIILDKQNNYRLAIQSFRLDLVIPNFLVPIKEGFVDTNINISGVTNATPAVITTSSPHGLNKNDYIKIQGVNGMVNINNVFFVSTVISSTQFTIKNNINTNDEISSIRFNNYISGGKILTVNDDINLTDYGFCFSIGGNNYSAPVYFIPDKNIVNNKSLIPLSPKNNSGLQDKSTFYYYSFSFEVFAEMMNNALTTITNNMNTAEGLSLESPYFEYDNNINRFKLVVPYSYVTNNIDIYVNTVLNKYLVGFRTYYETANSPIFKDYKYIVKNYNYKNSYVKRGQVLPVPPVNPTYLSFLQEYDGRYRFDEITNLVITSNYIRTRDEYYPKIGNPNSYYQYGKSNNDFNTGTSNILSSFELIDSEGNLSWKEVQYYNPRIYKWIDLVSDDSLTKVDATVFFETKKGEILPAYIDSNSLSNIRLVFERIR